MDVFNALQVKYIRLVYRSVPQSSRQYSDMILSEETFVLATSSFTLI